MARDPNPNDLRMKAAQARRIASIRTQGGQAADRQLMAFANRLEQEAAAVEETPLRPKPPMAVE
jgi:hypothetical protein